VYLEFEDIHQFKEIVNMLARRRTMRKTAEE
jgi:hypothetical protein